MAFDLDEYGLEELEQQPQPQPQPQPVVNNIGTVQPQVPQTNYADSGSFDLDDYGTNELQDYQAQADVENNKSGWQQLNDNLESSLNQVAHGTIDWWKNNVRPLHFMGDVGKATVNGFRDESILGANAITGAKNWTLDRLGLQSWHRPTEEVKQEREDMIPKFDLNEDAKVANFIGDTVGWAPSFAVGGEGVAAGKTALGAGKTYLQSLLRGKKYSDMAKILARKSSIDAIKNSGKALTKSQKFLNGVGDLAKSGNNAGLDLAAFEGIRNSLQRLGGDNPEHSLGQAMTQGYISGVPIGAGFNLGSRVAKPILSGIYNSQLMSPVRDSISSALDTLAKYRRLNNAASDNLGISREMEDVAGQASQFDRVSQNEMYRRLRYGDNYTAKDLIEGDESPNAIIDFVKGKSKSTHANENSVFMSEEDLTSYCNLLREGGMSEEEIRKILIDNDVRLKGDTATPGNESAPDSVYNDMDEFSGNAEPKQPEQPQTPEPPQEDVSTPKGKVTYSNKKKGVLPEDYTYLVEELMKNGKTQEEAVEFLHEYGIDLPGKKFRRTNKHNEFTPEAAEVSEQPQGDLSTPKQETDINTPKEDLTHVNGQPDISNDTPLNVEQPKVEQPKNTKQIKNSSKRRISVSPDDYMYYLDDLTEGGMTQEEAAAYLKSRNIVAQIPNRRWWFKNRQKYEFINEDALEHIDDAGNIVEGSPKMPEVPEQPKNTVHMSKDGKPLEPVTGAISSNKDYVGLVHKDGTPVLTKQGKHKSVNKKYYDPEEHMQDKFGNLVVDDSNVPIKTKTRTTVSQQYRSTASKTPSDYLTETLGERQKYKTTTLEPGEAAGSGAEDKINELFRKKISKNEQKEIFTPEEQAEYNRTQAILNEQSDIYRNVEKIDHSETNPEMYDPELIGWLKSNYRTDSSGNVYKIGKKGKPDKLLSKQERYTLEQKIKENYKGKEEYSYKDEDYINEYDKKRNDYENDMPEYGEDVDAYNDDVYVASKNPYKAKEFVSDDEVFNEFFRQFEKADEEQAIKLFKGELNRRGNTKEAFNQLYKDFIDQADRDRINAERDIKLGDEPYQDEVSDKFYKLAKELGKNLEENKVEYSRPQIRKAHKKERYVANKSWENIYKTILNNKKAINATNPSAYFKNMKVDSGEALEHAMNAYKTKENFHKVQAIYNEAFDAIRNSNATARTREILFDDLENIADRYVENHKYLGKDIDRKYEVDSTSKQAKRVLKKIKDFSGSDEANTLVHDNEWLLKTTKNWKDSPVLQEHFGKRTVTQLQKITDLTNFEDTIKKEIEKVKNNSKLSAKQIQEKLNYIENNKYSIYEKNLEKARRIWKSAKGYIKNSLTDWDIRKKFSYDPDRHKWVDTGDTWGVDEIGKRDAQWKEISKRVENLLDTDIAKRLGMALEEGANITSAFGGKSTTLKNLMRMFPEQFKGLENAFDKLGDRVIAVGNGGSRILKMLGKNTVESIRLYDGANFDTLKHELCHDLFFRSALKNDFVMEHHVDYTSAVQDLSNYINKFADDLFTFAEKYDKGIYSVDHLINNGEVGEELGKVLKGFESRYYVYKTSAPEMYCDMVAAGKFTGSPEEFVKAYNKVYPEWLKAVKKGDIWANDSSLERYIEESLQGTTRASKKTTKPVSTLRQYFEKRQDIAGENAPKGTKDRIAMYDVKFDSKGIPDKPEVVEEVLDYKGRTLDVNFNNVRKSITDISKQGQKIAEDWRWITPEQAANRIKMVGGKEERGAIYFKQGGNGLSFGDGVENLAEELRNRNNSKEGLSGRKKTPGLWRRGSTADIVINTAKETTKRLCTANVMDVIESNFAKAIPTGKAVPKGYTKINRYVLSFARHMGLGREFIETVMKGDEAIDANYGKLGDGGFAKGLKALRKGWMKDGEYHYMIPEHVRDFVLDEHGEKFVDYIERYITNNPKENGGVSGSGVKATLKLFGAFADFMNERFKRGVLTSSSFFLNNRIGNQMMIAAHADNPIEYVQSIWEALTSKTSDMPTVLRESIITDSMNMTTRYQIDTGIKPLDDFFNVCRGNFIYNKEGTLLQKTGRGALNTFVARPNRAFNKLADFTANVNQICENFERKQAFYIKGKHIAKNRLKEVANTYKRIAVMPELIKFAKQNPEFENCVINSVEDVLGNYRSFNKYEKNIGKRIVPFISWFRTALRHEITLFRENPVRWAMIHYELAQLANDNKGRKEYQRNAFNTGLTDEDSSKVIMNKGAQIPYNTYLELADNIYKGLNKTSEGSQYGNLANYMIVPFEAFRGRKAFLNQEIQDRRYVRGTHWDDKANAYIDNEKIYDTRKDKNLDGGMPWTTKVGYGLKNLVAPTIYAGLKSPLANLEYWASGTYNMSKGRGWKTPDKYYDSSYFGYYAGDKYKTSPGGEEEEKWAANDLSEGYKLSNRLLGTTFQKEREPSMADLKKEKEQEEKRKQWKEKHKRRK